MTTGRGAWTKLGGTTPYYELTTPMVGSLAINEDPDDITFGAVNFGVKAIQILVESGATDGVYGASTKKAVKKWQKSNMPAGSDDGVFGPVTAKALIGKRIATAELNHKIPGHYLFGIAMQESELDPGAVGYYTPDDKGIFQFNLPSQKLTAAEAFDPTVAVPRAANRFEAAWKKYSKKTTALQIACSIAQHNSPVWADEWYTNGTPPNSSIAKYVTNVEKYALEF